MSANKGTSIKVNDVMIGGALDLKRREGDVVIQLFDDKELLDETIISIEPGIPRLVSESQRTPSSGNKSNMTHIPAGHFNFRTIHGDEIIPHRQSHSNQS